jgi:hypothetical protein
MGYVRKQSSMKIQQKKYRRTPLKSTRNRIFVQALFTKARATMANPRHRVKPT